MEIGKKSEERIGNGERKERGCKFRKGYEMEIGKREVRRGKDSEWRKEGKGNLGQERTGIRERKEKVGFFLYSTLFNITPSTDPQIPLCTDGCWGRIEPWTVSWPHLQSEMLSTRLHLIKIMYF
jgi:hypothetical protein